MANLPTNDAFGKDVSVDQKVEELRKLTYDELGSKMEPAQKWGRGANYRELDAIHGKDRPMLPICPYGCGRAGTLLEIVMGTDGRAMGIFNDHPCSCVFVADIQLGEPPTKKKMVIGADGEYHEVEGGD